MQIAAPKMSWSLLQAYAYDELDIFKSFCTDPDALQF